MEIHEGVREYVNTLSLEDVPWHRLPTAYGRAGHFPNAFHRLFAMDSTRDVDAALDIVFHEAIHQETFWAAAPLSAVFLYRAFEQAATQAPKSTVAAHTLDRLLELFSEAAEGCQPQFFGQEEVLPALADLLKEEFLWSEHYDEAEDEARYEEEGGPFTEEQYVSFYYYTYQVLLCARPTLESLKDTRPAAAALLAQLQ